MTTPPAKKSDLPVRAASAVVMLAVAGTALWLGGWVWTVFVAAVALGVLWEWWGLVARFESSILKRGIWLFGGIVYVGVSCLHLNSMLKNEYGLKGVLLLVGAVIAVDIGAYFAGRTIGGPKIAPKISPSKTWSGLTGGMITSAVVISLGFSENCYDNCPVYPWLDWIDALPPIVRDWFWSGMLGAISFACFLAIIAQSGDFFESWMKRRAGVKDSGSMIPGHGGLFDRVDGLLAVMFVIGLMSLAGAI